MPSEIGKFFDEPERESVVKPDSNGSDGDKTTSNGISSGISSDSPEAFAWEPIEQSTVRIDDTGNDGIRLTKSGRPDRRTKSARTKGEKVSTDLGGLSIKDLLITIASGLQGFTRIEEFEIDEGEAQGLADATQELGKIYGHSISPKALAWTNFAAALGKIAGPRVIAYQARMKVEKAARGHGAIPKPGPVPVGNIVRSEPTKIETRFPTPSQVWPEAFEGF